MVLLSVRENISSFFLAGMYAYINAKHPRRRRCMFVCFVLFCFVLLCLVQILTPWREPPAPEKEAFMTFWLTRDALVHVCVDSRTPASKLPSWLEYAGFRDVPASVE